MNWQFWKRPACAVTGHDDDAEYLGKTGKLSFSFDCARPQILIRHTCKRCGRSRTETMMSGMPHEAIPLTPDVARQVLRDEFGLDTGE